MMERDMESVKIREETGGKNGGKESEQ